MKRRDEREKEREIGRVGKEGKKRENPQSDLFLLTVSFISLSRIAVDRLKKEEIFLEIERIFLFFFSFQSFLFLSIIALSYEKKKMNSNLNSIHFSFRFLQILSKKRKKNQILKYLKKKVFFI